MLTNQRLQSAINEIREITHREFVMYTPKGKLAASTFDADDDLEPIAAEFAESLAESQTLHNYQFFKIIVDQEVEYILVVRGTNEEDFMVGRMAVCQLRNLVASSMEQFDRNSFMQNVLLGNMLAVDMFSKAKRLHIEDADRVVFVIDTGKKNNDEAMEMVRNLFNIKTKDFVTSIDEHSIVLIKDVSSAGGQNREEELSNIASYLVDTLHMEAMVKVRVGYGNIVSRIPEIAESFQEAKMALEVGRIFYAEYDTISYGKLGIGRLIYQLPMSLCRMFIQEVFGKGIPDIFEDEEVMSTINKFFDNNLNISETARQLYVHRNTLVYRLERIEKSIGLDIRRFDDAMTFQIANMVLAHIRDQEEI